MTFKLPHPRTLLTLPMSELEPGDKRSAFIGMVVTAALLFVFAYSIVLWTNSKFAGGEAHVEAPKH